MTENFGSIVHPTGGSSIPPVNAGTHLGICIQMIDLGTQESEWEGKIKHEHKVRLTFELPEETHVFDEEKGPEPRLIGKEYSFLFGPKANFRKLLDAWLGHELTQEEIERFSEKDILGKGALVNVIHKQKKNGPGVSAVINGISPVTKSMTVPNPTNEVYCFFIPRDPSHKSYAKQVEKAEAIFDTLPEWIQKQVEASPEWQAMKTGVFNEVFADEDVTPETSSTTQA